MPNKKAELLFHTKERDELGNTVEMKAWLVAVSEHAPHGLKYSLVYVVNGMRLIGYDNERGKGDHRHYGEWEEPYRFTTMADLVKDFKEDMARYRETDNEGNI
jgi:uncharacterized protein DUF6516